jgi:hypothetical protein
MKKILTVLMLLMLSTMIHAQSNLQDVIYLKDGSIVRGTIIEQIPAISVNIETVDHSVMVIKMDKIEKIVKEPPSTLNAVPKGNSGLKRGYLGMINIGYGIRVGQDSKGTDFAKFDFVNGYQFNPYLYTGFGTGLRYYFDNGQNSLVIPMFVDIRGHFSDYFIAPYIAIGLGYSLEATPQFQGLGFMINPSIGATFKTGKYVALNFGIGYVLQMYQDGSVNSINLDLGFSF